MKFTLNQPFETDQSVVDVDAGLPPGAYRFQLVVVNQAGRRSRPTDVTVNMLPRTVTPPVVIDPRLVGPIDPAPGRGVTGIVTPLVTPVVAPTPTPPASGRGVVRPAVPPRTPRRPNRPPPP